MNRKQRKATTKSNDFALIEPCLFQLNKRMNGEREQDKLKGIKMTSKAIIICYKP